MRVFLGILLGFLIIAVALVAIAATGSYNVSAVKGPSKLEKSVALFATQKSIEKRAPSRKNPFSGPEALRSGLAHFKENCVTCHGAPGVTESEIGMGLNPPAPDLTLPLVQNMTDGQIYWVVANGIRMTGMPAFSLTHSEEEIWKMVAFVRHLPEITTEEQNTLKAGREEEEEHHKEAEAGAAGEEKAGATAGKPSASRTPHTHPPGTAQH
jgi:mono/diheme cytochrome c family protein